MSQDGYDKLIAELKRLEGIERPKASAAIAEARDKGDLSENSEYEAAKEAQAHLESKINLLKQQITEAKIVDTSRLSTDSVQILSGQQGPHDLHHRQRERGQPEGGQDLDHHPHRPGPAEPQGGRRGGSEDPPRRHQTKNRENQRRVRRK